jgi:H+-transporting ATPase
LPEINSLPEESRQASATELLTRLKSSPNGLTEAEAQARLESCGCNEIVEKKTNPILKFLSYFWGPIPWMIEVAAALSAVIHHWEDFWIIFILLLLNAIVGFWQEYKADNAIELLKEKLALQAKVLRDGAWRVMPARELVPGDIVRVRLGDIVPADLKLLEGDYLLADESALTGESLPVEKHVNDEAFTGSNVIQGEMNALVIGTGMCTFFGKTARLVQEAKTISHFQKAVVQIGNYLIILAVALVAVILLIALFRHENMIHVVQFALVLTVAAIPVALPPVLSVTLAVGAVALAKRQAIVSKLVAIEEMAGMDILCSDKTGTITKSELTLAEVVPWGDNTPDQVILLAALASRAEDQDPIDTAVLSKLSPKTADTLKQCQVTGFKPFDPVSKRTQSTVTDAFGHTFQVTKGASQVILDLVSDKDAIRAEVEEVVNSLATRGFRTLGVARTESEKGWEFCGILPLVDPPREDSAATIETAQEMGVEVKMVTGDHVAIAKEIAGQVHLGQNIQPVAAFLDKPDRDAREVVEKADGFAQVFPEHKCHIVELFQEDGHIVGMTGDGVNDAPARKKADGGVAVAGATDAAKSAADIVLTSPGLSVIVDAIKESRKIFQRMNNYAIYRITETLRVLFFIALSIIIFKFYPVTAVMIVLLALLNDAPILAIAYDRVQYAEEPEKWDMRLVLSMATILGIYGVLESFLIFYLGESELHLSRAVIQSFIFLKLAVAGHLTIFAARTRGPFWSIRPGALMFWAAVATKLLATLIVVYGWYVTPLGWKLAGFVWGYSIAGFLIMDAIKVFSYKLLDHREVKFQR